MKADGSAILKMRRGQKDRKRSPAAKARSIARRSDRLYRERREARSMEKGGYVRILNELP